MTMKFYECKKHKILRWFQICWNNREKLHQKRYGQKYFPNSNSVRYIRRVPYTHRKIRLIEGNGKYLHPNNLTCNGTLGQVFISLRPRTSYPPPPYTLSTYSRYTIHTINAGKGGVESERMGEGQQFTKLGLKYQHMTLQPINSHGTCRKVPIQVNFLRWRHVALVPTFYRSIFLRWRHFALAST
jgi:hypothetical protein